MRNILRATQLSKLRDIYQIWLEQVGLPYYQSLAIREQRLLLFSAVSLPIMLLIFAIALPLYDTQKSKQQDLQQLQKKAVEAETIAAALQKNGPVKIRQNTMTAVDSIARETHIRQFVTRMKPQIGGVNGQRLLIQMRSAPYNKVIIFLGRLSKEGLSLKSVKMQKAEASGTVHFQAVVE